MKKNGVTREGEASVDLLHEIPRPCSDYVLLRVERLRVSPGGILLPEKVDPNSVRRPRGEVVAIGPRFVRDDFGVGDLVYFDSAGGTMVEGGGGEPLMVLHPSKILCVVGRGRLPRHLPGKEPESVVSSEDRHKSGATPWRGA